MSIGLITIACLLAGMATDAQVSVTATLDPPEVPFHRTATYTISVEAPSDVVVNLPALDAKLQDLDVTPQEVQTQPLPKGRKRVSQAYRLDPVSPKTHILPAVEVKWGENEHAFAPAMAFHVRDLTSEEQKAAEQLEDIVGPEILEGGRRNYVRWAAGTAVAVALIAAGIYAWRKRRHDAPEEPPLSPWETAMQRLNELTQRQLPESGRFEAYYVDLSAIVRYYIEDRFYLRAPEQTTQEFLEVASRSGLLTQEHQEFLAEFLKHSDRVKFARYQPTMEQMERVMILVRQFIEETVPHIDTTQVQEAAA